MDPIYRTEHQHRTATVRNVDANFAAFAKLVPVPSLPRGRNLGPAIESFRIGRSAVALHSLAAGTLGAVHGRVCAVEQRPQRVAGLPFSRPLSRRSPGPSGWCPQAYV